MQNNENFVDNFKPCTIETIDFALFNWVDKIIDAHCNASDVFKKVPVIWTSAERSFQIKNYKDLRDKDGSLITPFISVERGSITKSSQVKGAFQANIKGFDRIALTRVINQEKTSKYANNTAYRANKKINFAFNATPQIVYQTKSIRIPTYIDVEYTVSVKTSYLQQINEILIPFINFSRGVRHFLIEYDNFRFEAFMGENFEVEEGSSNLESEERQYISKINIKVTGFLIGEDINQKDQRVQTYENPVSIKLPRENIIIEEKRISGKRKANLADAVQVGETVTALKKTFTIGDGNTIYIINHKLNTRDMYISIRENFGSYDTVQVAISFLDLNNISIDMGDPIDENHQYVVTIIG